MMAPYPFQPMTNEMLKKLTQAIQDSNQTFKSPDYPAEFASQEHKSTLEVNSKPLETNQSNLRTNNRY
jgi:hypothetical protein